jgi:hypothetical protein
MHDDMSHCGQDVHRRLIDRGCDTEHQAIESSACFLAVDRQPYAMHAETQSSASLNGCAAVGYTHRKLANDAELAPRALLA